MKSIELTKHVLDQVRVRKKLIGRKAEMFIEDKFKRMYKSPDKIVTDATRGLWKIRVGNEKIVYAEDKNSFTLITYIIKTEYDRIEYNLLKTIKYHANKENSGMN